MLILICKVHSQNLNQHSKLSRLDPNSNLIKDQMLVDKEVDKYPSSNKEDSKIKECLNNT